MCLCVSRCPIHFIKHNKKQKCQIWKVNPSQICIFPSSPCFWKQANMSNIEPQFYSAHDLDRRASVDESSVIQSNHVLFEQECIYQISEHPGAKVVKMCCRLHKTWFINVLVWWCCLLTRHHCYNALQMALGLEGMPYYVIRQMAKLLEDFHLWWQNSQKWDTKINMVKGKGKDWTPWKSLFKLRHHPHLSLQICYFWFKPLVPLNHAMFVTRRTWYTTFWLLFDSWHGEELNSVDLQHHTHTAPKWFYWLCKKREISVQCLQWHYYTHYTVTVYIGSLSFWSRYIYAIKQ